MIRISNDTKTAKDLAASLILANNVPVFDLDGVVVDATHRQICKPDGSLDLEKYRENSTAEKISKDKELPLLETMRILQANNVPFHVCTARVFCENTENWLTSRGVKPASVMARSHEEDSRKDYRLKTVNLESRFPRPVRERMVLIDDNLDNCKAVRKIGLKSIHVPFTGH